MIRHRLKRTDSDPNVSERNPPGDNWWRKWGLDGTPGSGLHHGLWCQHRRLQYKLRQLRRDLNSDIVLARARRRLIGTLLHSRFVSSGRLEEDLVGGLRRGWPARDDPLTYLERHPLTEVVPSLAPLDWTDNVSENKLSGARYRQLKSGAWLFLGFFGEEGVAARRLTPDESFQARHQKDSVRTGELLLPPPTVERDARVASAPGVVEVLFAHRDFIQTHISEIAMFTYPGSRISPDLESVLGIVKTARGKFNRRLILHSNKAGYKEAAEGANKLVSALEALL